MKHLLFTLIVYFFFGKSGYFEMEKHWLGTLLTLNFIKNKYFRPNSSLYNSTFIFIISYIFVGRQNFTSGRVMVIFNLHGCFGNNFCENNRFQVPLFSSGRPSRFIWVLIYGFRFNSLRFWVT